MPNHFDVTGINWRAFFMALFVLLVISLGQTFQLGDGTLYDPFHQGEYFSSLTTLTNGSTVFHPLTIHGAMDYIPGLITLRIFGDNNYFFATILSYKLLSLLAGIIFLFLASLIIGARKNGWLVLLTVGLVAHWLVGYRDVLLLLSVLLYFLIQKQRRPIVNTALSIVFGVSVACGLYWSFDRGIAGAAALGLGSIVQVHKNRTLMAALFAFLLSIYALGHISDLFSLNNYIENLKFLFNTSSQWSYGWEVKAVILTLFLAFANILAISLLLPSLIQSRNLDTRFAVPVFLIALSLILFKITTNRADMTHILWGLWGPALIGLYWLSLSHDPRLNKPTFYAACLFTGLLLFLGYKLRVIAFIPLSALLIWALLSMKYQSERLLVYRKMLMAALLLPFFISLYKIPVGFLNGKYSWISHLDEPPINSSLATEGVRWASKQLTESNTSCVFDLANNGVINGLTGLPTCSRFSYLVYANQRYEDEIISTLREKQPEAIVSSTAFWSFNIDGRTMDQRFPDLNKFIQDNYVEESCAFDYCVRYLTN